MWPDWTNTLTWWQWSVLAIVPPAIVALYFLKLRRRTVEVPSTYLWQRATEELRVNSLWQRLRNTLLLMLQLAALALLLLALGRPAWQTDRRVASRTIFMIDNSASMASTDVRPSRLDEAKRRVLQRINEMGPDDVAMVISFSNVAQVEQPYSSNRAALRDAVRNIAQTRRSTDLAEAMKLAAGLANPSKTGDLNEALVAEAQPADVLVYSDGRFGDVKDFAVGNLNPTWVPIGTPEGRNVGIVGLAASSAGETTGRLQVFTRLYNAQPSTQEVVVELYRDDGLIDADRLTLEPKERRGIVFELESTEQAVLEVRLDVEDDFAFDNRAWLVINAPHRLRTLVVTPGNPPLRRALNTPRAQARAEITFVEPAYLNSEQYEQLASSGELDLIVYDRCRPSRAPQANAMFIADVPDWNGWSRQAPKAVPQVIDTEQAHPLMQWVEMGDVLFAEATPLQVPEAAVVLVDSSAGPLVAIAPRQEFEDVVLGFELFSDQRAVTNWSLRASFPVFVLNVLEYFARQWSMADRMTPAIRPGQEMTLPVADRARLVLPDGSTAAVAPASAGKTHFTRTEQLGVYTLQTGEHVAYRFAVNLSDLQESHVPVDPKANPSIGNVTLSTASDAERSRRELWKWLIGAALVVLVAEWWVYQRRIAPRRMRPRFTGQKNELSEAWVG